MTKSFQKTRVRLVRKFRHYAKEKKIYYFEVEKSYFATSVSFVVSWIYSKGSNCKYYTDIMLKMLADLITVPNLYSWWHENKLLD